MEEGRQVCRQGGLHILEGRGREVCRKGGLHILEGGREGGLYMYIGGREGKDLVKMQWVWLQLGCGQD